MWTRSILLVCSVAFCETAAAAAACDSQDFNSHSDQTACEIQQNQRISQDVDRAFDHLMAANDRFNRIPGTKRDLFTAWLKSDQARWRAFTTQDCALQGGVTMGTAGSDVEQQCLQDAYRLRIAVLRQMAQTLNG
jgi:hypothetical protein